MATPDLADPSTYDFFTEDRVRFSDTDLIGHVNNVSHVALVESGRIDYVRHLVERVELTPAAATFVRLEVDFRADLFYPARVRIGGRALAVGRTSFRVGVGVFDGDRCVSTSVNVLVHLGQDGRPTPIPDDLRRVLEAEIPT